MVLLELSQAEAHIAQKPEVAFLHVLSTGMNGAVVARRHRMQLQSRQHPSRALCRGVQEPLFFRGFVQVQQVFPIGHERHIDERLPTQVAGRQLLQMFGDVLVRAGNGTLKPRAVAPPLANGTYKIINVKSGKALEVPGASKENIKLDQAPYKGGANQQWIVTDLGGGSYSVQNVNSKSVADCSPTYDEAHPTVQWPINGTPSATQRFTLTAVGGHYVLTNVFSGKALDILGSSSEDGAIIIQSACTAKGSQLWDITPVK